jgi:hypothetical protein
MATNPIEPIRLYAEDDHRLPRTVERELMEMRASLIAGLAEGAAKDFADYRDKVGEIRGLSNAISICQDAKKQLSEH